MNTKELISKDEKIRRATMKIFTEVVMDRNVSHFEIASGIYKPIINPITLIDIEKLVDDEKKRLQEALRKKSA